ncbi:hypothetical protein [Anaeromicropila populeti]|uniref:Uncharacterized protein n=1 Tax=Anaeromicropila populeti TaxID=37658 RepID=A0A1I6KMB1_9FIRM|nr:hypothetical protein [Anaeromicropila populeti]SFR92158.1 hypothetical protein SAMN05661086_02521 [Anaeromicropila populeti]
MKILMIGNKESGKTTYMASSFGILENGQNGFYLKTDTSSNMWFKKVFETIKQGQYPELSDKRNNYQFELYHHQKKILDFEWIDYYGGVILESNVSKLTEDIGSADGIILFLDAISLLENNNSVHQFRRILGLITNKLTEIESGLFSVIVVITKADMVPNGSSLEQLYQPLSQFISSTDENKNIYARIVPVSCTNRGFYNVELPLLDMLDSGMKISYLTAIVEAKQYAETCMNYNKHRGILDWTVSRLSGVETNGELAEKYRRMAMEKIDLYESIEEPMERLSEYVKNYVIRLPWDSRKDAMLSTNTSGGRRLIEL